MSRAPTVLYRYQNSQHNEYFRERFDTDFNLLSAASDQQALELLQNPDVVVNALVLDQDHWPLTVLPELLYHPAVKHDHCITILLHTSISIENISQLLELGTLNFCYQKPFDQQKLQSDVIAAQLGVVGRINLATVIASNSQRPVLMLVDDERHAARYLKKQIDHKACGIEVQLAHDGAEALRWLEANSHECCVLLTDQRMPGLSGKELMGIVKAKYPLVVRMLTSAYPEVDVALNAVNEEGIFRYLPKPWRVDEVIKHTLQAIEYARQKKLKLNKNTHRAHEKLAQSVELRRQRITEAMHDFLCQDFHPSALADYFHCLQQVEVLDPVAQHLDCNEQSQFEQELIEIFCETLSSRVNRLRPLCLNPSPVDSSECIRQLVALLENNPSQPTELISAFACELLSLMGCSSLKLSDLAIQTAENSLQIENTPEQKYLLYSHLLGPVTRISQAMIKQQVNLFLVLSLWAKLGGEFRFAGAKQSYSLTLILAAERDSAR